MAEQVSHNVVNVPESASGSNPVVDVVANHDSAPAAESGTNLTALSSDKTNNASEPQETPAIDLSSSKGSSDGLGQAAAEPSAGDAAAKSDNVPVIATPADADEKKKLDQGSPTLNGVTDIGSLGSAIEDGGSQDVSAVNSDTELGKGEPTESKDGHLHVRTNSVKKPATFSKVSSSKNFLAKSASPAPVAAKTGERGKRVLGSCANTQLTFFKHLQSVKSHSLLQSRDSSQRPAPQSESYRKLARTQSPRVDPMPARSGIRTGLRHHLLRSSSQTRN